MLLCGHFLWEPRGQELSLRPSGTGLSSVCLLRGGARVKVRPVRVGSPFLESVGREGGGEQQWSPITPSRSLCIWMLRTHGPDLARRDVPAPCYLTSCTTVPVNPLSCTTVPMNLPSLTQFSWWFTLLCPFLSSCPLEGKNRPLDPSLGSLRLFLIVVVSFPRSLEGPSRRWPPWE